MHDLADSVNRTLARLQA
ncbi:hypothetical protein, partial [Nonomuraea sp. NPDC049784]